jgi:hypothetical protein
MNRMDALMAVPSSNRYILGTWEPFIVIGQVHYDSLPRTTLSEGVRFVQCHKPGYITMGVLSRR